MRITVVEELEGGFGITRGVGVGAAEVSGADDVVEGFGDAGIVGIGFGEGEDLRGEPVGCGVEFQRGGPFGLCGFRFGFGEEIGVEEFLAVVKAHQRAFHLRVPGEVVPPVIRVFCSSEGTPPIVVEAVHVAWRGLAADASGNVRMKFGAMENQEDGGEEAGGVVSSEIGFEVRREIRRESREDGRKLACDGLVI